MKKLSLLNWIVAVLFLFFIASCNKSLEFNPSSNSNVPADLQPIGGATTASTLLSQDVWVVASLTPGGKQRISAVSFTIGENAYVGTGFTAFGIASKDFWKYNPSTNVWTQIADFGGEARTDATGFGIDEKGYVGTGRGTGGGLKDFWEYNSLTNGWNQKKDFGGGIRIAAASLAIGKKGYVGLGFVNATNKDFWEYDPSVDQWTRKADFRGSGRLNAVSFVLIDSKNRELGYLGGGDIGTFGQNYADFWQYFPVSDIWRQRADLPENFAQSGSFTIGSKGYVVGNGKLWMFDPLTSQAGSWVQKANFAGVMDDGFGFSLNGHGYIGGGNYRNGNAFEFTTFYKYFPN